MFQGKEFFSKILIVIKRSKWNWAWWRKNMLLVPWYSFLQNRFYSLWCLQRPPASVGVIWTSTNTYRELWWWEDFRLHANACPVWFCRFRAFCFNRCEWKSKNKFKIYSREISRNVGYSLYKGHFMVKVRSDFWRIYLWIVDFEIYRIFYFIYLYRTFWFRLVFWAR